MFAVALEEAVHAYGHFVARDVGWTERPSRSRPDQRAAPR